MIKTEKKYTILAGLVIAIVIVGAVVAVYLYKPPEEPIIKERLVAAFGPEWASWEPAQCAALTSMGMVNHIFEPLGRWEFPEEQGLTPTPWLATSWARIDETHYIFHLREGVMKQNGKEFTAWDVKATYDKILDPDYNSPQKGYLGPYNEFTVVDNYTIVCGATRPFGSLEIYLSVTQMAIQAAETIAVEPVGTGPYEFVEWKKGESATLERFDEWWGAPSDWSAPKEIEFKFIPEITTRVNALETGEVDWIYEVPPKSIPTLESEGFNVTIFPAYGTFYLCMNTLKAPFNDTRVRYAIAHAIDTAAIATDLYDDIWVPATNIVPEEAMFYEPHTIEYDLDEAERLLADAGYADGFSCKIYTPVGRYLFDKEMMEMVAEMLNDVGITVEVVPMEWTTYVSWCIDQAGMEIPSADMYLFRWTGWSPQYLLRGHIFNRPKAYNGTAIFNAMGWYETEELCEEWDAADESEYSRIAEELYDIYYDDLPAMPLLRQSWTAAHVPELKNWTITPYEDARFWYSYFEPTQTKSSITASFIDTYLIIGALISSIVVAFGKNEQFEKNN